ncbi:hypothetical protein B0H10DRAFT_2203023 [Mycena sp. CBHHK59/15]|nr:hypothetical protein B0H10DRAFT_2203630 [Mycena sp. CBHHK59/15]KAJ6544915.1 hypothetical protein B0H10DRAFT_2203023 [Mycena sp. CBHHK59/15]
MQAIQFAPTVVDSAPHRLDCCKLGDLSPCTVPIVAYTYLLELVDPPPVRTTVVINDTTCRTRTSDEARGCAALTVGFTIATPVLLGCGHRRGEDMEDRLMRDRLWESRVRHAVPVTLRCAVCAAIHLLTIVHLSFPLTTISFPWWRMSRGSALFERTSIRSPVSLRVVHTLLRPCPWAPISLFAVNDPPRHCCELEEFSGGGGSMYYVLCAWLVVEL